MNIVTSFSFSPLIEFISYECDFFLSEFFQSFGVSFLVNVQINAVPAVPVSDVPNVFGWNVLLLFGNPNDVPDVLPEVGEECVSSIDVVFSVVVVGSVSWVFQL
jgi:hypothetical protein